MSSIIEQLITHNLVFQNEQEKVYLKCNNGECEVTYRSMNYPYDVIKRSKIDVKKLEESINFDEYLIFYSIDKSTSNQICYDNRTREILI